jgi:hypothetical protein
MKNLRLGSKIAISYALILILLIQMGVIVIYDNMNLLRELRGEEAPDLEAVSAQLEKTNTMTIMLLAVTTSIAVLMAFMITRSVAMPLNRFLTAVKGHTTMLENAVGRLEAGYSAAGLEEVRRESRELDACASDLAVMLQGGPPEKRDA